MNGEGENADIITDIEVFLKTNIKPITLIIN